ncbi:hypothetical protein [Thiocapsa sp.]|uniref:hypothetical protein n=1 Tax=Thiocapsa sp. TaxID=2024551 RepID=UPI0035935D66
MMTLTCHAQTRMQQRAISELVVDLVLSLGVEAHDYQGAAFYSLQDRKCRRSLARDLRRAADKLESKDGLFAVAGAQGELITVGHQYRRRQRDRSRGGQ